MLLHIQRFRYVMGGIYFEYFAFEIKFQSLLYNIYA